MKKQRPTTRKTGARPAAMGSFPKPEAEATAFFESLVPDDPRVAVRPMFGHQAAFVNGNMFLGVFGGGVFVRLGDQDRAALVREHGAALFEPMKGRPMKEYVTLPATWRRDPARARAWVQRSLAWAGALPSKAAKKPAAAQKRRR